MGMTIGRMVNESADLDLVGGIDIKPGSLFGAEVVESSQLSRLLEEKKPDLLIDFTVADAAVQNVKAGAKAGTALVIGTTGFTPAQRAEMAAAIQGNVPAVISSNYSIGVNIFWQLIRDAAPLLADYDIEVTEAHHRYKKDSPSGTARTILQILDEELGERRKQYGREGM
jgi:4-hydroxy-tetrahydrodipicolinate reductase